MNNFQWLKWNVWSHSPTEISSSGMEQQDEDDAKTELGNYFLYYFRTGNEI